MVEETDKPRRPAKPASEQKSNGSRSGAQSSSRGPRPASHSDSNGSRPQGSYNRGPRPQGQSGGPRPQGQSGGPRPQGSYNRGPRPQGQTGGARPQGQSGGPRPQGSYNRGPRPQGAGDRPAAPKAPYDEKNVDELEDLGLGESDDSSEIKTARLPKKNDVSNYSMSYRGSSQRTAGGNRPSPNRQNRRGSNAGKTQKSNSSRQSMLNTHKLAPFKYDMNEILSQSSMDPTMASSFLATIIAKASRISTKDAKEYAKTFVEAGNLTKDEFDKISRLMDRYSKYR